MLKRIGFFCCCILLGLVLAICCVYAIEGYLRKTDPFLNKLPFDWGYYSNNLKFYKGLLKVPRQRHKWSWGNKLEYVSDEKIPYSHVRKEDKINLLPEHKDDFRILVIGDSLTWGAGLRIEERYSNILERMLNQNKGSQKKCLVLNFSYTGAPIEDYLKMLKSTIDFVEPKLVIIGFCFNDTQPRSQNYRFEKEQFDQKYGHIIDGLENFLISVNLKLIARRVTKAIDKALILSGVFPAWEVGLDRTYNNSSPEWKGFEESLQEIAEICQMRGCDPPIFASLLHVHPNSKIYKSYGGRWYRQAEQAAKNAGFVVVSFLDEVGKLRPSELPVNQLDGHPSAKLNMVYAEGLYSAIRAVNPYICTEKER